jgi:hypothetical protein
MKKILIIVSLVLINLTVFSQDCTKENVSQIPGKWKPGMKGDADHSSADMVREKALMDDIIKTIRASFTWSPIGGDISYGNVYSIRGLDYRPLPVIKICNQYSPYIFYQHYFCSNGKIFFEDYVIRVEANINDLPFKFPYTIFKSKKDKLGYDIDKDPETDKYGTIQNLPKLKNGVIIYNKTNSGSNDDDDNGSYRILTKPGLLPYVVMTKKEFYEKWKINHLKTIEEYEVVKQKYVEAAKTTGDKRDVEMQESLIEVIKNYISKIDEFLSSKTPDELAKPAFVGEQFGEYYEASTRQDSHLYIIKPNLSYYNNALPKSSPQVVTISFSYVCNIDRDGEKHYADEAFYNELARIKIVDLLTAKLQPLIVR